ncbi:MAG TPA: glycosyltransferase family 2 protein [Pyrinomonadaceae bacterium]|nr:glycosyltransferase family 2 protein [Pyrinomonadaceae bacterium]
MQNQAIGGPLVTIGLAVFEEERYLRLTLESLLAQDYGNFRLIICDNASTDGTEDICREFEDRDPRIQYFRSASNVGAIANFNRTFELASGKYFMWAGAHDLWEPTFISTAVATLEASPEVVLVYPRVMRINGEGERSGLMHDLDMRGLSPLNRYLKIISELESCNMFHGLMRAEVLGQTHLLKDCWASDIILLAELALKGEFELLSEVLFYRREFRPEEHDLEQWKIRALKTIEGEQPSNRREMSLAELFREMRNEELRLIFRSNLSPRQKLSAMVGTIKAARARFGVRLPGDAALRVLAAMRSPRNFVRRVRARFHRSQTRSV